MLRFVTLGLSIAITTPAIAQVIVPAHNGSCPSGSNHAGSGYCRSTDGSNFVPANNGSCPSGSNHAGANYCRSAANVQFVPANRGSCPSGSNHAGSGYCVVKR